MISSIVFWNKLTLNMMPLWKQILKIGQTIRGLVSHYMMFSTTLKINLQQKAPKNSQFKYLKYNKVWAWKVCCSKCNSAFSQSVLQASYTMHLDSALFVYISTSFLVVSGRGTLAAHWCTHEPSV